MLSALEVDDAERAELLALADAAHGPEPDLAERLAVSLMDAGSLRGALESLAARAPGVVALDVDLPDRPPPQVEAAAYYLIAEALTNVTKYAQASKVRVRVATGSEFVVVEVADDGIGGADASTGSGLRGLADRVETLGGKLEVVSHTGAGTSLRAEMPLA